MFKSCLAGSIIFHVIVLIGVSYILPDNAVSPVRQAPIYLKLTVEPAVVKNSARKADDVKMPQTKEPQKQLRHAKKVRNAFPAVAGPAKPAAVAIIKRLVTPQPLGEFRPEESVNAKAIPVVATQKPSPAPVAKPRSSLNVSAANQVPEKSVRTQPDPPGDLQNPAVRPETGRIAPLDVSNVPGSAKLVATTSPGPGGAGKNLESVPESRQQSLVYAPPKRYPRQAIYNNWEGVTFLEVWIGPDGRVQKVKVVQSSGYAILDRAAEQNVKARRYRPAQKNGVAVASQSRVPVRFSLKDLED
jgi:protein TonB